MEQGHLLIASKLGEQTQQVLGQENAIKRLSVQNLGNPDGIFQSSVGKEEVKQVKTG